MLTVGWLTMSQLVIVEAFTALPDTRHTPSYLFSLFTLSVTAGNHGIPVIGDWLCASMMNW